MCGGIWKKFLSLLKKEAIHENEPQSILFLLRVILLILGAYFLLIPFVLYLVGQERQVWTGDIFALLAVAAFCATYRTKVHTSVLICTGLQLLWVIAFVVLYGWDCGIQHLMAVACSMFSSNVESAEKKLVLYNEKLKKQAGTDPLTGLWNRRQMLQYITEQRDKYPDVAFTIGMGDIDFFKKINDHWGHDCGDAVLVWLTRFMSRELSEYARLCRWGGEEFIFFFPRMNGDEVCLILNDLRIKLSNDLFDWRGEWIPITMTFGVEENDFKSSMDTLLKNVDHKLYIGKEQGRDRVIY